MLFSYFFMSLQKLFHLPGVSFHRHNIIEGWMQFPRINKNHAIFPLSCNLGANSCNFHVFHASRHPAIRVSHIFTSSPNFFLWIGPNNDSTTSLPANISLPNALSPKMSLTTYPQLFIIRCTPSNTFKQLTS